MMIKKRSSKWVTAKSLYTIPVALVVMSAYGTPVISNEMDEIAKSKVTNFFSSEQISSELNSQDIVSKTDTATLYIAENDKGGIGQVTTNKAELTKNAAVTLSVTTPDDPVFVSCEVMARPIFISENATVNDFRMWMSNKLVSDGKSEGRVIAKFIIEKDGSVSDVTIVRSLNEAIDNQIIEAIKSSGKWSPGTNDGEAVRSSYMFPIDFATSVMQVDKVQQDNKPTKDVNVFQKVPDNKYVEELMKKEFGNSKEATLVVVVDGDRKIKRDFMENLTADQVESIRIDRSKNILTLILK